MYEGKSVFAQLMTSVHDMQFARCVQRYGGHYKVSRFRCWDQWLFVSNRLVDANDVAKSIQKNLQAAAAEWNQSKDDLERERQRFEKVCRKLDDAINLRGVHWYIIGTLATCVAALLIGHYVWYR